MSAAPRIPTEFGIIGLRMTAEEYLALGETPERTELIEGVVVMSPSPTPRHSKVARLIQEQLYEYGKSRAGVEVFTDIDVLVRPLVVYRPDLCAFAPGRFASFPKRLDLPPELVVEVLSPSNRALDLVTKREDFDRFGVADYWVIDPLDGRIRVWARPREGGRLVERAVVGERVESVGLAGFVLDLGPMRRFIARAGGDGGENGRD